jgi:hypothetical protein
VTTRYEESRARAWAQVSGNLTPWTVELVSCAEKAIEYLMDNQGFVPDTKEQFAIKMGWVTGRPPTESPDRQRVEMVANLTRDAEQSPEGYPAWVVSALGGFVIAYSPNTGGLALIGEGVEIDAREFIHILTGDLQAQQRVKQVNRRRLPTWNRVARAYADGGDIGMAMLLAKGENEIATTGMVSDQIVGEVYKTARTLGYL